MDDLYEFKDLEQDIFKEMEDIQKELMKFKRGDSEEKLSGKIKGQKYCEEHSFAMKSMIREYGYEGVPDIRDELDILDEIIKENNLDPEEEEYIRTEYLKTIQKLVDAVEGKKRVASKMLEFFNKLRF